MPSNWLFVDTNFPTFTGEESTEDKISTMQNYMFMLVEQLRYSMHHLDSSNVRSIDMDKTKIYSGGIELMTMIESGEKMSVMQQRVDEIYAAVMDSGGLAEIVLGNDEAGKKGITATVADLEKGMASVVRLDKDGLWVIDEKGETVFLGGGDIILDGVLMSGDGHNWIQMQDVKLEFCNSASKTLVRAADIVANKVYYHAVTDRLLAIHDVNNLNILNLP